MSIYYIPHREVKSIKTPDLIPHSLLHNQVIILISDKGIILACRLLEFPINSNADLWGRDAVEKMDFSVYKVLHDQWTFFNISVKV